MRKPVATEALLVEEAGDERFSKAARCHVEFAVRVKEHFDPVADAGDPSGVRRQAYSPREWRVRPQSSVEHRPFTVGPNYEPLTAGAVAGSNAGIDVGRGGSLFEQPAVEAITSDDQSDFICEVHLDRLGTDGETQTAHDGTLRQADEGSQGGHAVREQPFSAGLEARTSRLLV